ncbi:MAG: glycosyltransferase 87 family protein [Oscillospiraceae bacterium]|nr:glycosyltransferase 87 family protein [Oscillospiraceae bacterium]
MDARVLILLCLEALFALWLLWRAQVLNSTPRLVVSLVLIAAAFVVRGLCLDYQTLDYQNFLSHWVAFYRTHGGFRSFSYPLGNYNIPYMYFLCLFSYLPISDLCLIKLLSIFFDVVLAYASMRLLRTVNRKENVLLACFFVILFLPTVILNGALWGQCDSIYVALAVLAVAYAMEDRPILSVLCFTLSFGFKLQAVFLLPILAVFWFRKRMKLWHFLLFPVFYVLLVLPAVALGKPFLETLTLYASQTGSIGDGLNYNSPSIYAIFWRVQNTESAAALGIAGAFTYLAALLLFAFFRRKRLNDRAILTLLLLMAVGIPFLLPHMHDRYFFAADVLSVVFAFACPLCSAAAPLTQFASLLGYHAYLKMRYLLYMDHGARALIGVLLLAFARLLWETRAPDWPEKAKN